MAATPNKLSDSRAVCVYCDESPATLIKLNWFGSSPAQGKGNEMFFYCTDCANELEATIEDYMAENADELLGEAL